MQENGLKRKLTVFKSRECGRIKLKEGEKMLPAERLRLIKQLLTKKEELTTNEVALKLAVSKDTVRRDFDHLAQTGQALRIHGGLMTLGDSGVPNFKERTKILSPTHLEPTLVTEADLKSLTGPVYKFMLICFDLEVLGKLKAALLALGLENVSIVNSNPTYIEITHKDATKANAIAHVQAAEKITKDQLMAFGDGENDLPMLTAVGTAVVVANASAKIKQVADFISKSNDEDGVAYAIKKLILDAEL